MGYSDATGEAYNLPYDVPANQYQTMKGTKASTSRRLAVFVPDFRMSPSRCKKKWMCPVGHCRALQSA